MQRRASLSFEYIAIMVLVLLLVVSVALYMTGSLSSLFSKTSTLSGAAADDALISGVTEGYQGSVGTDYFSKCTYLNQAECDLSCEGLDESACKSQGPCEWDSQAGTCSKVCTWDGSKCVEAT